MAAGVAPVARVEPAAQAAMEEPAAGAAMAPVVPANRVAQVTAETAVRVAPLEMVALGVTVQKEATVETGAP